MRSPGACLSFVTTEHRFASPLVENMDEMRHAPGRGTSHPPKVSSTSQSISSSSEREYDNSPRRPTSIS